MTDEELINEDILISYVKKGLKQRKDESMYEKPKHRPRSRSRSRSMSKVSNRQHQDELDSDNSEMNDFDDDNVGEYMEPLKAGKTERLDGKSVFGGNLDEFVSSTGEKIYRHGVIHETPDMENKNVSFYSSVLHLIKEDFYSITAEEQNSYVKEFVRKVINCSQSVLFERFKYKSLGWSKKSLAADMRGDEITSVIIRFVSDFCHINIFIFDVEKDMLYYSGFNPCIIHKKNIILLRHPDSIFEPLSFRKKFCNEKSRFMKYIIKKPHLVTLLNCNFKEPVKKKKSDENVYEEPKHFEIGLGNEDLHIFAKKDISDLTNFENIKIGKLSTVSYKKMLAYAEHNEMNTSYFRNGERRKIRKDKLMSMIREHLKNKKEKEEEKKEKIEDNENENEDEGEDEGEDEDNDNENENEDEGEDEVSEKDDE